MLQLIQATTGKTTSKNTKTCSTCNKTKPLTEFHFNNKQKNTYKPKCKPCTSVYVKSLRSNKKNNNSSNSAVVNKSAVNMVKTVSGNSPLKPLLINSVLASDNVSAIKGLFLQVLKHVLSSSTGYNLKEEITVNVVDLIHNTDVNGVDAYDSQGRPHEVKTNFVSMKNEGNKIRMGGRFNDLTDHKLKEIPNYTMVVSIFVDEYLYAVASFPGSWAPFMQRITDSYNKSKGSRPCGTFSYTDWKDCPDLKWLVLPDAESLIKFQDKISLPMFKDILGAYTKNTHSMLSNDIKANINFDI